MPDAEDMKFPQTQRRYYHDLMSSMQRVVNDSRSLACRQQLTMHSQISEVSLWLCRMPGVHSKDASGEPAWLAGHWRKRDVLYWAAVAAAVPVLGRALWWTAEKGYNMVTPYEVNTPAAKRPEIF